MTVCIAARSGSAVFLVSDRMVTAGDMQFAPPLEKIMFLTSSIAVMAAGDSAFHHEIMGDVMKEVNNKVESNPTEWINVKDVVDLYLACRNKAKLRRSGALILAPLGLDHQTFLLRQKTMDAALVSTIATDLINFDLPHTEVIIAGLDAFNGAGTTHIYSIHKDDVSCDDVIGFRAIGSGARHAESHFMLARHAWNSTASDTVMLAYRAKKDSEVAPGVGAETDMFMIGPALGQNSRLRSEVMGRLEVEYKKLQKKQNKLQIDAAMEIKRYVDSLPDPSKTQGEKPASLEASKPDVDASTPDASGKERKSAKE